MVRKNILTRKRLQKGTYLAGKGRLSTGRRVAGATAGNNTTIGGTGRTVGGGSLYMTITNDYIGNMFD